VWSGVLGWLDERCCGVERCNDVDLGAMKSSGVMNSVAVKSRHGTPCNYL